MTLQPGSLLQGGKYKIEQMLGQGGFGITYLGVQTGLNRRVAIKEFFMKEYCNRDHTTSQVHVATDGSRELVGRYRQKFLKEAQTIAVFEHPCIVKIYDIFEENGTAYYVMEYIGNGSLKDKVDREGRLSEDLALKYIRQVAEALDYVHDRNIVHLDVKPSNILLRNTDMPVLIDFGISKRYDETGSQTSSTPVGISKGYAPLEQYQQGGVENFQPATDIYSLGATLYFLLTGKQPPEATVVYNDGLPAFPSSVSPLVAEAVKIAMNPKVKERPQRIGEFLELLEDKTTEKVQADEPIGRSNTKPTVSSTREETLARSADWEQKEDFFTFLRHNKGGALLIVLLGALWWWFSFIGGGLWDKNGITVISYLPGMAIGCILCIGNLQEKMSAKSFFALLVSFIVLYMPPIGFSWYWSGNILSDILIPVVWVAELLFVWYGMKKEVALSVFHQKVRWVVLPLLFVSLVIEAYMLKVL